MTITNGYGTLAAFKTRFNITSTDATRDVEIEAVIEGVSRQIDETCHRVFYATTAGTVRYFTAHNDEYCNIDDCLAMTVVQTDLGDGQYSVTWAQADYNLVPYAGAPYNQIEIAAGGVYSFPLHRKGVKLTGTWGYSTSAPKNVAEACYIQSYRIWERRGAPFGVTGGGEMGQAVAVAKLDPDVMNFLTPYIRMML